MSALDHIGLSDVWDDINVLASYRKETGFWKARRAEQAKNWFEDEVRQGLLARLAADPRADSAMASLAKAVGAGQRTPGAAAAEVLAHLHASDFGQFD